MFDNTRNLCVKRNNAGCSIRLRRTKKIRGTRKFFFFNRSSISKFATTISDGMQIDRRQVRENLQQIIDSQSCQYTGTFGFHLILSAGCLHHNHAQPTIFIPMTFSINLNLKCN